MEEQDLSAPLGYEDGMDQGDDEIKGPDATATEADDADFRALAEDWIAIWQSEITAYLNDPETQAHWSAMVALWGEAAQAMMRAMPTATGFSAGHDAQPATRPARAAQSAGPDAAARTASAADASQPRDDEVRRLEQRVAELERRLESRDDSDAGRPEAGRSRGPVGGDRRASRGRRARV